MVDYSIQNKRAWEYNAYEFWVKQSGTPVDKAKFKSVQIYGKEKGLFLKAKK